jgi:Cft2 family RNA processing exonuclease
MGCGLTGASKRPLSVRVARGQAQALLTCLTEHCVESAFRQLVIAVRSPAATRPSGELASNSASAAPT